MSTACMVAGAIIVLAVAQLFLQKDAPVYAVLVSIAAVVFLLLQLSGTVQSLLQRVVVLGRQVDGQAFACLLRCAGILLVTDYARTFCEEAGASSLGWCAGFAGRCLVLGAAWPLLEEICQKIWSLGG